MQEISRFHFIGDSTNLSRTSEKQFRIPSKFSAVDSRPKNVNNHYNKTKTKTHKQIKYIW